MPLGFVLEAGLGWLRVEDRTPFYTFIVVLRVVVVVAGTIIMVVGFQLKVIGVLLANNGAILIAALLAAGAAFRVYRLSFEKALFLKMMKFAMPLTLSALGLFVIHFGDRFFLPRYRPLEELGIYAVAYKVGMLISIVQASFGNYWAAQIYQIVKRPDVETVFARALTYMTGALALCGLGLLVEAKPILILMTSPAYHRAIAIVPIIILAYFIRSLGDFFRFVFLAKGLPHCDAAANWLTAAVALAGYFLVITPNGILGAAWATQITLVAAGAISMIWVYRVWPYKLESARLTKLIMVTATVVAVHFALPEASVPILILRGAALLLVWGAALFLLRFPSPGEMDLVRSLPARIQRKMFAAGGGTLLKHAAIYYGCLEHLMLPLAEYFRYFSLELRRV